MPPLSATDAITPAWEHTRRLLLGPRRAGLLFKIAAVAFFSEMGGCNSALRAPGQLMHGAHSPFTAGLLLLAIVIGGLVAFCIALILFYIGSRLQFVLFHVVLRRETWIAPIWRTYGPATWRWIGLRLLFLLAAIVCMVPILLPAILLLIPAIVAQSHGDSAHIGSLILAILFVILAIFLFVIVIGSASILLHDFGLPSMALEAAPMRETVRRILALARAETGQVALYVLMRYVLTLAGTMASYLALLIVALIVGTPLGAMAFGLWTGLHLASPADHALMIAGWVVLGLIFLAILAIAVIALFGYLFTFLQAYAIYFLAGRYPLLAAHLEGILPAPAPTPTWPPAFYPTPEPPPAF